MKAFSRRKAIFALICAVLMLCMTTFQVLAENAPATDGDNAIGDVINNAIGDAISEAAGNAANDLIDKAENLGNSILHHSLFQITSIDDINAMLLDYSPALLLIVAVLAIVFGLYGYRLFNVATFIGGFASGVLLASTLYAWVISWNIIPNPESIPPVVPYIFYVLCGIVLGVLAKKIVRAGIFMACAIGGYIFLSGFELFNTMIDQIYPDENAWKYTIARIIVAVIIGAIALMLTRPTVILATSAIGGTVAAISIMVALHLTSNLYVEMVVCLILIALCAYFQFKHTGSHKQHAH